MKNLLSNILDGLWQDYVGTNPPAQKIHDLFTSAGEQVVNDHIALRTFNAPQVSATVIAEIFTSTGYRIKEKYTFDAKKLSAMHLEHQDPDLPLIFISELRLEEFDPYIRRIIQQLIQQIPPEYTKDPSFLFHGRPWSVSYCDYLVLKEKSEYAAWLAAFGFRANHFTVSVNHLKKLNSMQLVNNFLKEKGIHLNDSGGEIKGSAKDLLEQSSTIAYNKAVTFSDQKATIPACYYEFALRHKKPDGTLFRGFVTDSADKIFESTDKGQDI